MKIKFQKKINLLREVRVNGYGEVMKLKLKVIQDVGKAESIRDFGGLYIVHGRYLLESAASLSARYAQMIDISYTPAFEESKLKYLNFSKFTKVDFLEADFRLKEVYLNLKPVEISILYEVLLHQDNCVEFLRNVSEKTTRFIFIAQPTLKESLFTLPNCTTNIQFMDENLKDELREGSFWPKEEQVSTFTTKYWMWGQTISYLISVMNGIGWDLIDGFNCVDVCGTYWDFPIMKFGKR
jgi:hypothetical protein